MADSGTSLKGVKVLIASGGTGGHFYPGWVLGKAVRAEGGEVLFVVKKNDMALPKLESDGFAAIEIDMMGLPRAPGLDSLRFLRKFWSSMTLLGNVARAWRPRVAVGMGAYLTFPAVLTAWRFKIPAIIHEANAVYGLANRVSAPFVRKIALGMPLQQDDNDPKTRLTGTPIRSALWSLPAVRSAREALALDAEKRTVLVFGGSQGAHSLNRIVPEAIASAGLKYPGKIQALHISGGESATEIEGRYGASVRAKVLNYLERMELAYAAADLVICRAGASTLAEIIALRKPALLIPYPLAAEQHQRLNAQLLSLAGCALMVEERELSAGALAQTCEQLLFSNYPGRLEELRQNFSRLHLPAPDKGLEMMLDLIRELSGGADA